MERWFKWGFAGGFLGLFYSIFLFTVSIFPFAEYSGYSIIFSIFSGASFYFLFVALIAYVTETRSLKTPWAKVTLLFFVVGTLLYALTMPAMELFDVLGFFVFAPAFLLVLPGYLSTISPLFTKFEHLGIIYPLLYDLLFASWAYMEVLKNNKESILKNIFLIIALLILLIGAVSCATAAGQPW